MKRCIKASWCGLNAERSCSFYLQSEGCCPVGSCVQMWISVSMRLWACALVDRLHALVQQRSERIRESHQRLCGFCFPSLEELYMLGICWLLSEPQGAVVKRRGCVRGNFPKHMHAAELTFSITPAELRGTSKSSVTQTDAHTHNTHTHTHTLPWGPKLNRCPHCWCVCLKWVLIHIMLHFLERGIFLNIP